MNGGFTEVEVPPENPGGEVVEGDGGEGHRKLHPITFSPTLAWWWWSIMTKHSVELSIH